MAMRRRQRLDLQTRDEGRPARPQVLQLNQRHLAQLTVSLFPPLFRHCVTVILHVRYGGGLGLARQIVDILASRTHSEPAARQVVS
jgi:hypothetical protein